MPPIRMPLCIFAMLTLLPGLHASANAPGAVRDTPVVVQTRCEFAPSPLGVDTPQPRLTWVFECDRRDVLQQAYQVLVASTPKNLASNTGDLWDSGKVMETESAAVYQGAPLASRQAAYWKVRVWDERDQAGPWSPPDTFEMGLLQASDWKGDWIGLAGEGAVAASPLLRTTFVLFGSVKRARLYWAGIGWSECYVNGTRVGDAVLDPAATDYDKRVLYVSHDVTTLLHDGLNALGVTLGNGWYSQPGSPGYGDTPRLRLMLFLDLADGSVATIASDEGWRATTGPILQNSIWGGEVYDARLEQTGWLYPDFDDAAWPNAAVMPNPGGRLESQTMAPIRAHVMPPVAMTNPRPGVFVYDFGQLFGGWARLRVKGAAGTKIALRYSARVFPEGTPGEVAALQAVIDHDVSEGHANPVEVVPGMVDKRHHHGPDGATDYYILKGDPDGEVFEPRFTFHPVRYVQVEGYPGVPALADLEGRAVHADADGASEFQCSDPLLNQIHRNCARTFANHMMGIPLDSLYREYWGWLEPASNPAALFERQFTPRFWSKFLRDVQHAQYPSGVIPDVVPNYPPKGRTTGDPAWAGNYPLVVWYLYQYYGDERLLRDHYPNMKGWVAYLRSIAENNLIEKGGYYGDHMLPGDAPGQEEFISKETPQALCWTAFYYNDVWILAQTADRIGATGEAADYRQLASAIRDAFNAKWLDPSGAFYATNSQSSNIIPLAFGLVPEAHRNAVQRSLIADIMEKRGGHLHTGNFGTACVMDALAAYGGADTLYQVASSTEYPGWGYMVSQGATTIWEAWGGVQEGFIGYNSGEDSMPMFSSISEFLYGDIAGIQGPDYFGTRQVEPGFREVVIRPRLPGDLTHASARIHTVRGPVAVGWSRDNGGVNLKTSIPANARGRVSVPKAGYGAVVITESGQTVWRDGAMVPGVPGLHTATNEPDYITFEVGSGEYRFEATP